MSAGRGGGGRVAVPTIHAESKTRLKPKFPLGHTERGGVGGRMVLLQFLMPSPKLPKTHIPYFGSGGGGGGTGRG